MLAVDTIGRLVIQPSEIPAATLLAIIGGPVLSLDLAHKKEGARHV
ncbi:hypothetical protein ACW18Z_05220 [Limosilactobacillus fermentum]